MKCYGHDNRLQVACREARLAQHAYRYDRKARRLGTASRPQLHRTVYTSPELELWELGDEQRCKVLPRPYQRHGSLAECGVHQLGLLA